MRNQAMGISTAPGGPPRRPACPCTPAQQQEMAWRWCGAAARVVVGNGGWWSRCGGQRGIAEVRTSFCSVRAFSWYMEGTVEVLGTAKDSPRAPARGSVGASLDLGADAALGPCTRERVQKDTRQKHRWSTCLLLPAVQRRRVESLVLGALSSSPVHRALVLVLGTNIAVL